MFSSRDGDYIICGSEDHCVYIFNTERQEVEGSHKKGWRRDRNSDFVCFNAHDAVVTAALFAPWVGEEELAPASSDRLQR